MCIINHVLALRSFYPNILKCTEEMFKLFGKFLSVALVLYYRRSAILSVTKVVMINHDELAFVK